MSPLSGPRADDGDENWDDRFSTTGTSGTVHAIAINGTDMYVVGNFTSIAGLAANRIARWDSTTAQWSALGSGLGSVAYSVAVSGSNVYVGGEFSTAGDIYVQQIARWDGTQWYNVGGGLGNYSNPAVRALAVIGSDLYVGGDFGSVAGGSVLANNIARWDGTQWHTLGNGVQGSGYVHVASIAVSGGNVYAGGHFTTAGGITVNNIARWDGSQWYSLGSGVTQGNPNTVVYAILPLGSNLYVRGSFTYGGTVYSQNLAGWNGSQWFAVGNNALNEPARALAAIGNGLYVGGHFSGSPGANIAQWDLSTHQWSTLAGGVNDTVNSLTVLGNDLYVGGNFTTSNGANGSPMSHIARWDGTQWHALGSGVNNIVQATGSLGTDVFAGGFFTIAGNKASNYFGIWHLANQATPTPSATASPTPQCPPTGWQVVPSASAGTLFDIAGVSTNDMWAVGTRSSTGSEQTLVQHWDGSQWSIVPSPNIGTNSNTLWSVDAIAPNDIWAVGFYYTESYAEQTLTQHWDGNQWTVVPSPNRGQAANHFRAVSAISTNDIWAVGYSGQWASLAEHWDGTEWSIVSTPGVGSYTNMLLSVSASGSNDVWAAGVTSDAGSQNRTMMQHWNGSQWAVVPSDNIGAGANELYDIESIGVNDVWAVGSYTSDGYRRTLVLHNGDIVSSPSPGTGDNWLRGLADDSTGTLWAAGTSGVQTLIERYYSPCSTPTTALTPTTIPTTIPTSTHTMGPTSTTLPSSTPASAPCTITFTDVPSNHTFYNPVRCLACRGIISGYSDGTFKPDNLVTRGQLAKIVSNAALFTQDPGAQIFEDVATSSTFYAFINRLTNRGYMGGYTCGGPGEPCVNDRAYFRPGANATRGQTAKIVSNAKGYIEVPTQQTFEDVPPSYSFYQWIQRLASHGAMGGYNCGGPGEPCGAGSRPYFRPGNNVTRGQSAKIVANTFFPDCQAP